MLESNFNFYYQNVRGLRTKASKFFSSVVMQSIDVITLTETWLNEGFYDRELFDDRYVIYRTDRNYKLNNSSKGGGVLIAIKSIFTSSLLFRVDEVYEAVCIKARLRHNNVFVCVVYFPPGSRNTDYLDLYNKLELISGPVLIIGDFNFPLQANCDIKTYTSTKISELNCFIQLHNLKLYNSVPNSLSRTLDLVLTNLPHINLKRVHFLELLTDEDSHHPALSISINLSNRTQKTGCRYHPVVTKFNFKRANYLELYKKINCIDWSTLYNLSDVNIALEHFYNKINEVFVNAIPKKKLLSNSYPKWFTSNIIKDLKLKDYYRKRRYTDDFHNTRFKSLRTQIKKDIEREFKNYINEVQNNIKTEVKSFWNYIASKRAKNKMPATFTLNNVLLTNGQKISDAFNDYFTSVHDKTPSNYNITDILNVPTDIYSNSFKFTEITDAELRLSAKFLKPKLSTGFDGIPPFILKGCFDILISPLKFIFNLSIKTASYPKLWKIAKIKPILKSGDKNCIVNYRPISILSAVSKLYERILFKKIYDHVKTTIVSEQHGFLPKRSTITNLLNFTNFVSEALESKKQVDVVYTDFTKAFDRVNHDVLLLKLHNLGFTYQSLALVTSYLSSRYQFVDYQGFESNKLIVGSGIPQGSNLGPLFFLCYVNDIKSSLAHSSFLMFADDLKLFKTISNLHDCTLLQDDLDSISDWATTNKLPFNIKKCQVVTYSRTKTVFKSNYTINNLNINTDDNIIDLGIKFDSKLKFDLHINSLLSECHKLLGFIFRQCKPFTDPEAVKLVFNSLVRSKIEYGSILYFPKYRYLINNVEKLQKRLLRYLYLSKHGHYPPYIIRSLDLMKEFNVPLTSLNRVTILKLSYIIKLVQGEIDDEHTLNRLNFRIPTTRQTDIFYTDKRRTLLNVLQENINSLNKLVDIDISIPYTIIKQDLLRLFYFKI